MDGESNEALLSPAVLQAIVAGTTAEVGVPFFDRLVAHLSEALGTRCAWVTEWLPERRRLRALSFWVDGRDAGDYEYDVAGTPCEDVVERCDFVIIPERVVELYPADPDLPPLGGVSYLGIPLLDTDGALLGHLAVLHDRPLRDEPRLRAVFEIFAGRAAAELRRLRRDLALREREERLSGLIGSARDAILEFDEAGRLTALNPAGEALFRLGRDAWPGRAVERLLGESARPTLAKLIAELAGGTSRSLWLPEAFEARRADGSAFPAEATLACFDANGRRYYSLILRDVEERLASQARIASLVEQAEQLRAELDSLQGFDEIVGRSPVLRTLLADVERVADTPTTILITGETGTGKELVARALHRRSRRAAKPLVAVNCAAIPATLQESEFFGHERGAFTGATTRRIGRFQQADGGTLFLDEVGELPLDLQAKLLRVLQEGELEPVGGQRTVRVDVRVIAATHRDLEAMVAAGRFRQDLLYRLNVFPIRVPPLRERGEDVILLAERFAQAIGQRLGRVPAPLGEVDRARLRRYDWPGNVRELRNVIERAVLASRDGVHLDLARALPDVGVPAEPCGPSSVRSTAGPTTANAAATAATAADAPHGSQSDAKVEVDPERVLTAAELRALERANLERALVLAGGKVAGPGGAAERLGMHPNTLASRLRALGLRTPRRS